jgi:outer membrane biogenesis lipoprotein LolB
MNAWDLSKTISYILLTACSGSYNMDRAVKIAFVMWEKLSSKLNVIENYDREEKFKPCDLFLHKNEGFV